MSKPLRLRRVCASRPSGFWIGRITTIALARMLVDDAVVAGGEVVERVERRVGAALLVAVDVAATATG
jgi:hypothetical protein